MASAAGWQDSPRCHERPAEQVPVRCRTVVPEDAAVAWNFHSERFRLRISRQPVEILAETTVCGLSGTSSPLFVTDDAQNASMLDDAEPYAPFLLQDPA